MSSKILKWERVWHFYSLCFQLNSIAKIPFNHHFKALLKTYKDVVSKPFYLVPVNFKSSPKINQNVENVKVSKSVTLLFACFQLNSSAKNPISPSFKDPLNSKGCGLTPFNLIPVVIKSFSIISQNDVENLKMSKSVTLLFALFSFEFKH